MTHIGILDDMEHEAKYDTDTEYRKSELRIQELGAAISRRDWHATEKAYEAIRDKFYYSSCAALKDTKPMTDIVEWLKCSAVIRSDDPEKRRRYAEAADEIARLRDDSKMLSLCEGDRKEMADKIERLRTAMQAIIKDPSWAVTIAHNALKDTKP